MTASHSQPPPGGSPPGARKRTRKAVAGRAWGTPKRENTPPPGERPDAALLQHFKDACKPLSTLKAIIAQASGKRTVAESTALFNGALEALTRAENAVGALFQEGATWQRKFAGLEETCGTGPGLNLETVAWLYWSCKRFFETGLPALVSLQESTRQCGHCQRPADLPFAILSTNLGRLRDVLQHCGATMPELCLQANEKRADAQVSSGQTTGKKEG
jgi:hypothetical protein